MGQGLTLGTNVRLLADRWSDRTVFVTDDGDRCSYREFNDQVNALAWSLRDLGVGHGDAVALLLPNTIEYNIAYFAPQKLGAVTVPVNHRISPREVAHILARADADVLIADGAFTELARKGTADLSRVETITVGDGSFAARLDNDTAEPAVEVDRGDVAYMAHTSGSTGQPKLIPHTHDHAVTGGAQGVHELEARREDRGLCLPPLFHTAGMYTLCVPLMFIGGTTILQRAFDPAEALALIESETATILYGVPAQLRSMLRVSDLDDYDLSSLRQVRTGASPMIKDTIEEVKDTFSENFHNSYGLTECQQNVMVNTPEDADGKEHSIGKATYFWEARPVEPAEPTDLNPEAEITPPGTGLLLVRGPAVMDGYVGQPEKTAETLHDGWVNTGDVVEVDEAGYFYVIDRMDNMFISGGENIYPHEVEMVLESHPGVIECGVFGQPDDQWGGRVTAAVVLSDDVSVDDLDQFLRASDDLANFKRPREYVVVDEIPRGPSGSIQRQKLPQLIE